MVSAKWWMRSVGALYLLQFVLAAIAQLPIRTLGPAGVLDQAAAGDPTARLLVDTWITLGLEFGAVGVALVVTSLVAERANALVWTVLGLELLRGMVTDVYMITRGYEVIPHVVWIVIHTVIIVTGLLALRNESGERAGDRAA